jgi:hypothetical protein
LNAGFHHRLELRRKKATLKIFTLRSDSENSLFDTEPPGRLLNFIQNKKKFRRFENHRFATCGIRFNHESFLLFVADFRMTVEAGRPKEMVSLIRMMVLVLEMSV